MKVNPNKSSVKAKAELQYYALCQGQSLMQKFKKEAIFVKNIFAKIFPVL